MPDSGERDRAATIIVVGWRSAPHLLRCLQSLDHHVPDGLARRLVVLNEPTESVRGALAELPQRPRTIASRTNLGFGGAVDLAARQVDTEFLVLLNDDCVVEPRWLEELLETADRRPPAGCVGSTFRHPDGSLQEAGSVVWRDGSTWAFGDGSPALPWTFERPVDYCSGGSLLVRTSAWREVGGFDDRYYPAYYEDVDLCLRLRQAGWETWYSPLSVAQHIRGASSGSRYRAFLGQRSRAAFVERWSAAIASHGAVGDVEDALWRAMGRPLRILVIDDLVPSGSMGSGFGRARDMLHELAGEDSVHVALHPRNGPIGDLAGMARLGVRVIEDLDAHLSTAGVQYDTILISRPHNAAAFGERVARLQPQARIVYDAEAMYHLRLERHADLADNPQQAARRREEADEMRRLEIAAIRLADHVVCISEQEAALARSHTTRPVSVVAPLLAQPKATAPSFHERRDIGFVAGWLAGSGAPNSDALLWFARDVLPLVQARAPGTRLLVTGGEPPEDVSWLRGADVEFVGLVGDLAQFYAGIRVAVSPTRYGAGVKLKTVEAVQYGVPVVATSEGAAGLDDAWRSVVCVADSPSAFAVELVRMLTDSRDWSARRTRGLELISAQQEAQRGARWLDIACSRQSAGAAR